MALEVDTVLLLLYRVLLKLFSREHCEIWLQKIRLSQLFGFGYGEASQSSKIFGKSYDCVLRN